MCRLRLRLRIPAYTYTHEACARKVTWAVAVPLQVNLVPVVAKADTLTKAEMERLKLRLRTEIAEHGIRVYQLPDCDTDEDEEYKEQVGAAPPCAIEAALCQEGATRMPGMLHCARRGRQGCQGSCTVPGGAYFPTVCCSLSCPSRPPVSASGGRLGRKTSRLSYVHLLTSAWEGSSVPLRS